MTFFKSTSRFVVLQRVTHGVKQRTFGGELLELHAQVAGFKSASVQRLMMLLMVISYKYAAQLAALLPCSKKFLSSNLARSVSARTLHVLPVYVWFPPASAFSHSPKTCLLC